MDPLSLNVILSIPKVRTCCNNLGPGLTNNDGTGGNVNCICYDIRPRIDENGQLETLGVVDCALKTVRIIGYPIT